MPRGVVRVLAAASALLVAAACGKSGKSTSATTVPTTSTTAAPATTTGGPAKPLSITLRAEMTGPAEVPPGPPAGSGTATVTLQPETGQVCFEMTVKGVAAPSAAHIHEGVAGVAGPIVVPLTAPASGSSKGCVPADRALIARIVANPSGYYVNVHNAQYPKGAVRGQLHT